MRRASYALWPQTQCQSIFRSNDSPATCCQLLRRCFCRQWEWIRERHPHSPWLSHSSALPLGPSTERSSIRQKHADLAWPTRTIFLAWTPLRLSPRAVSAHTDAVESVGRAGDPWLKPSAWLQQRHLRGQIKGCAISEVMALGPQWL